MPTDTDRPRSDHSYWLEKFQELSHNTRLWVRNGQSETTVREIDAMWKRWSEAPDQVAG